MGLPCGIVKRLPREIAERYLACGYLTGAKSASNFSSCLCVSGQKKQGWMRRRRRKRDNPSPVKCAEKYILSASYKTFITLTIQRESVKTKIS